MTERIVVKISTSKKDKITYACMSWTLVWETRDCSSYARVRSPVGKSSETCDSCVSFCTCWRKALKDISTSSFLTLKSDGWVTYLGLQMDKNNAWAAKVNGVVQKAFNTLTFRRFAAVLSTETRRKQVQASRTSGSKTSPTTPRFSCLSASSWMTSEMVLRFRNSACPTWPQWLTNY